MARKFLYAFAVLIMLVVAAGFAFALFGAQLIRWSKIPSAAFEAQPAVRAGAYADPKMWIARPNLRGNPALWTPAGYKPATQPRAAVFFIHPTSYISAEHWNGPIDDPEANAIADLFLRGQASAFNEAGLVWSPRYRQATFGAFLTNQPEAGKALDLAYGDVATAFDQFLKEAGDRPIILAGHSQGAFHLTRLLRDRIAGTPLEKRIVAAYVVGWPVSKTADLPRMGLPECRTADQAGCVLSWLSFAEPADPSLIFETFDATSGLTGDTRRDTQIVCTNPISGTANAAAPATANLGTLIPAKDLGSATLQPGEVPARCERRGLLMIGTPPDLGNYVLPGNNYHVYDYSLFWVNVRADVARRLATFAAASK